MISLKSTPQISVCPFKPRCSRDCFLPRLPLLCFVESSKISWNLNAVTKLSDIAMNVCLASSEVSDVLHYFCFTFQSTVQLPNLFRMFHHSREAGSRNVLLENHFYIVCFLVSFITALVPYIASSPSGSTFNFLFSIFQCFVGDLDAIYALQKTACALFLCDRLVTAPEHWSLYLNPFTETEL